jgi:hypothetical protein
MDGRLTMKERLDSLRGECARVVRHKTGRQAPFLAGMCRRSGIVVALAALAVAGCASISPTSPPEEKQKVVAERAEARWQLLIKGDVAGAYEYLSAGSKAATPLATYSRKIRPGLWRTARVDEVNCEAEVCNVKMLITYQVHKKVAFGTPLNMNLETPVAETWIIENGSGWYVYR